MGGTTGQQTTETNDTRRRAVTSNLVQNAATDFAKSFTVQYRREIEGEGLTPDDIAKLLTDFVINGSKSAEATFNKLSDNQWQLAIGPVNRLLNGSEVTELLKSSGNPHLSGESKQTATANIDGAQLGASKEDKSNFTDARGIEWTRNDKNGWIPTKAKLHFLVENDLRDQATVKYETAMVKDAGYVRLDLQMISSGSLPTQDQVPLTAPPKMVIAIKSGAYRTQSYWGKAWRTNFGASPRSPPRKGW